MNKEIERIRHTVEISKRLSKIEEEKNKKWIPLTQRKEEYTTPPEARALSRKYKKGLQNLKIMALEIGTDNPEYVQALEDNRKLMRKYHKLVKEYQEKNKVGKMYNPESESDE